MVETTREITRVKSWGEMSCYQGRRRLLKGGTALGRRMRFPNVKAGVGEEYERGLPLLLEGEDGWGPPQGVL